MPRPRTISDQDILAAVARVIGRVGPARLTLAAVAEEAGLAPATLLQRFGSRRAMLLALHQHDADLVRQQLRSHLDGADSILRQLVDNLVALAAPVAEPLAFSHHLAVLHQDLSDPAFLAQAQAHAQAMRREIERALRAAVTSGEIAARPAEALEQLARSVQTVYNGALITWAINRDGPLEAWLRRELDAVLR